MTINLYIGDNNIELAEKAISADPRAFLIDRSNYKEFLNNPHKGDITVYTSLADLPKLNEDTVAVYSIFDSADNIYYYPPENWSDNKNIDFADSIHFYTEYILCEFQKQKNNVHGLGLTDYSTELYTKLVDQRKTDSKQLWLAGCSVTHGVGVLENQRYGQLLADSLKMPVSFLTAGGSSISWAVDQIVRSDIRAGDIVILGATEEVRFPYWTTDNKVWHITTHHQKQSHRLSSTNLTTNVIDRLITDDNCFYQSIIRLHQLVNFCNKIDAKLLIIGLLSSQSLALHLHNINSFINYKNFNLSNSYVDLGSDNMHPGPLQHQLYADFCQSALKKLNYI
jgi:hypothetical protein